MNFLRVGYWVVVAWVVSGCGGASPAVSTTPTYHSAPDAVPVPPGELSPAPFTAEQLRSASPAGRALLYRQTLPGRSVREHRLEFVRVSADGATTRSTEFDEQGHALPEPYEREATWDEHRSEAEFPRARTAITTEPVDVPAGRFDTQVYTVTQTVAGQQITSRYWFAPALPGPPVRIVIEQDGVVMMDTVLVSNTVP